MRYFNLFLQFTFLMCGLLGLFGRLEDTQFWFTTFALWVVMDGAMGVFISMKEITNG